MVKISTLYSLENICDMYEFNTETLEVINTTDGSVKKAHLSVRGYLMVTLRRKDGSQQNVPMHKIIALSILGNHPYEVIEHLNDVKTDNRPENLAFSTQKRNCQRSFENGRHTIKQRIFKVSMVDGRVYTGPMKEIAKASGISKFTLYDFFLYKGKRYKTTKPSRKGIASIIVEGLQTIEKVAQPTMPTT